MSAMSSGLYQSLIESSIDGFWVVDARGYLAEVNQSYCQMSGYRREELLGMHVSDIDATESSEDVAAHNKKIMEAGHDRFESRHRRKDGSLLDVEISAHLMPPETGEGFFGFVRDVGARKQLERERLAAAIEQRDAIVRDVHHHIKNNLQGVALLLRQQAELYPEAVPALESAIARVKTVAVVHGLLGEAGSVVALCDMVRAISTDMQHLTTQTLQLEFAPHFKPVLLSSQESVPIALIVNELIFNAVKHGVARAGQGNISILLRGEAREMVFRLSNQYGKLPHGFDFASGRGLGLGLTLAKSLLPQQGAALEISRHGDGVVAELRLTSPVLLRNDERPRYGRWRR